ncbi:MAG: hypothetical protein ABH827_03895 [bacterium]
MALSNRKISLFFLVLYLVLFMPVSVFLLDMPSVPSNSISLPAAQLLPVKPLNIAEPNVSIDVNPSNVVTGKTLSQPIMQLVPHPHVTPLAPGQTGDSDIYLNFENTSLGSVMNYLAEQKKINILPHKDLDNCKVTLATRNPLTLERAWNVLLTLLEMNNFSIVKVDNLFRVVSNKESGMQPLPIYSSKTGTDSDNLPDSDLIVRYIYFCKNTKPEMAQDILSKLLEDGAVQINQDLQAVILKEKCFNIKAAMKIVKELDTGGLRESIKIIRLNYADAHDVKELFDKILEGDKQKSFRFPVGPHKESFYFSSSTKIIPDPIKQSLILLGTEKNLERLTDFIFKYVDVPVGTAESRIHIKEIRYAKSEDIQAIVQDILKPPAGQQTGKGILVGKYKFFEDATVVAEAAAEGVRGSGNRLLVACNEDDWVRLNTFIDKLDKPEAQVAFEVLVVVINEKQEKELGTQLQSKDGKQLGMGINRTQFMNITGAELSEKKTDRPKDPTAIPMAKFIEIASGDKDGYASFMTLGRSDSDESMNIWALVKSVLWQQNSHIISQPYVVANNHQECSVEIGEDRQVKGGLQRADGGVKTVNTWVSAKATNKVKLKPHINSDGVVILEIEVCIDEFTPDSAADTPTTMKRSIVTQTSLLAGQVLVLGGMKKTNQQMSISKTPILGDIPILGNLFKWKSKKKDDENLYIFIRPSIIKPQFEGAPDEYTQLKLDYAKYQIINSDEFSKDKDPIQRWFFKPEHYSVKRKLEDVAKGRVPLIDDFALGKDRPKMVNIKEDTYYRSSETIKKSKETLKRRKKSKA